ncbi:hypothetical protein ACHBTE_33515 [Streptomyces sp. M41]|uniref:hypothetical protein n=1 Tax=Streptomyces sp. M41 TaxID=3059412 RepID=UPI00374CA1A2
MPPAEALDRAGERLTDATERALRMIALGTRLPLVLPGAGAEHQARGEASQPEARASQPQAHAVVSGTQRPSSVR